MSGQAPDSAGGGAARLDRTLPCGQRSTTLLALVADGRTAHAELAVHIQACRHCQAEQAVLSERWRLVRRAAEVPIPIPPGLVSRVLASLDGLRGRPYAEPIEVTQDGGWLRVAERVVILLARQLAADLNAVHGAARIGAVRADDDGLHVHLSLRYGAPGAEVATALRERLAAGLTEHLGPVVLAVHVIIDDVHGAPPFG